MALIKCPECGNSVSTHAKTCPSCGMPISDIPKMYDLVITEIVDGTEVSVMQLISECRGLEFGNGFIEKKLAQNVKNNLPQKALSNISEDTMTAITEKLQSIGCQYKLVELGVEEQIEIKNREEEKNIIKCPRCGSTAITTGARGFSVWTGFWGSGKTVNRCAKCGHTWQPK